MTAIAVDRVRTQSIDDDNDNRYIHTRIYCGTQRLPIDILSVNLHGYTALYSMWSMLYSLEYTGGAAGEHAACIVLVVNM